MARRITGTNGNERIDQNGRPELDIRALGGNDTIVLDRDDDLGGDNRVDAGNGNDTVVNTFEGGNIILMGKGDDTYIGTGFSTLGGLDGVDGGAGDDRFFLKTLKSAYLGGKGDDIFVSDGWENNINGAKGSDTISYQFRHEDSVVGGTGVTIDLAAGAAQTGSIRQEKLTSIENAIGSERADAIGGTNDTNVLSGLGGADQIFGFGGNDVIEGGAGGDLLFGGTQADRFVYRSVGDSRSGAFDTIGDFSSAEGDRIDLSAMDGSDAFRFIGSSAFSGRGGEIRFSGGVVSVDVDGNRSADLVIDMDGLATMANTDFLV